MQGQASALLGQTVVDCSTAVIEAAANN